MGRVALLGAAMMFVFLSVAMILLRVIPSPHKETDYLVIGTLATFAALAILFVVLAGGFLRDPTLFFKRKKG